jgi:Protein of unknown function (DUF2950)
MNKQNKILTRRLRSMALVLAIAFIAGCVGKKDEQTQFASAQEGVDALVAALQKDDTNALSKILGPGTQDLLSSGDAVDDKADRADFLASYQTKHSLVADGAEKMNLVVGDNDWSMPIPLKLRNGKWFFDSAEGADEIVYRRIGGNELGAIDVMHGYVAAQLEYASQGHDGDAAGIYAMKLISDEGMQNGLYWPTVEGEPASPAGPFVAAAAEEGYGAASGKQNPYHGYYYRLLYSQTANAKSGAREYFKDGLLTEGFALVAWPAEHGSSGVQTFIINQDGDVFQKDLGEATSTAVEAIKSFDPDSTWTAVPAAAPEAAATP